MSDEQKIKRRVRGATQRLISRGILTRSDICEDCGSNENIQVHHLDYNDPTKIQWLCSNCHGKRRGNLIPWPNPDRKYDGPFPKSKELMDAELAAWQYLFGKVDDLENRIKNLELNTESTTLRNKK